MENIYTGHGIAPQYPQDTGRSTERLSDFIIRAEEIKANAFKQNEQEFLKNSQIDPAFFISKANQETQTKLLDDFNKKWSQKMRSSGYNMSTDDKMAMQAEKNFVITQQQEMQAKQDLWQQHRGMIAQNSTRYDAEEWAGYDAMYRKSGEYPLIMPPIKAKSIDMALEDNPIVGNEITKTDPQERNGLKGFVDVSWSGTEEQARQRVKEVALMDEAFSKDLIKQFKALDEETKLKYLDADKSGAIDEKEARDFNPIVKWAQDTKWQKALRKSELSWRSTEKSAGLTLNFNPKVGVGTGNNNNQAFDVRENVNAYGTNFNALVNLGRVSFTSDPQTIDEYVDLATNTKVKVGQATRFEVVSYSPDKDLIIVKIVDRVPGTTLGEGKVIGLEGEAYKDLLRNKPFYIDRASLLKQYGGTQAPAKKKLY